MDLNAFIEDDKCLRMESIPIEFPLDPADSNEMEVRRIIKKQENPNPIIVALIIFAIAILINMIFRFTMKPNLSGDWVSADGKYLRINHSTWTNRVSVHTDAGLVQGRINSNVIQLRLLTGEKIGALHKNSIYWNDGDLWHRPKIAL